MNYPKLKGKLKECGRTYEDCAKVLGISTPAFCDKINGKTKMFIGECEALANYLEMDNDDKIKIFLS